MKISVCDVCKHEEGKLTISEYRRGYKGWVKMDVCEVHKNYPMGDTPQEFNTNLMALVYGDAEVLILENPKVVQKGATK